jgi:hypothetical protein
MFGARRVPWRELQRGRVAVVVSERAVRIDGARVVPGAVVVFAE